LHSVTHFGNVVAVADFVQFGAMFVAPAHRRDHRRGAIMAGVQLSCPHCAARLSFGQNIPAGTSVSCLVCNRAFAAPGGVAVPVAAHAAAASKVQRSQTAAVTPGNSAARARSAPRASPAEAPVKAPPPRSAARHGGNGGRIIGGAALVGVAVLLLAGLGYFFWKNALQPHIDEGQPTVPAVAQLPVKPEDKNSIPPAPISEKNKDDAGKKKDDADAAKKKDDAGKKKEGAGPAGADDDDVANQKKLDKPAPPAVPITEVKPPPETTPPLPPPPTVEVVTKGSNPVPGVTQDKVDAAIAKGVRYLKDKQLPDGSWGGNHVVGYASLAGLTLLECKVPANDPAVQRAHQYVLANIATLSTTYEISAAIMFLDRLGDSKNRVLIQGLGVRLLAGQNDSGAWNYNCPLQNMADMRQLHIFLRSHSPVAAVMPAAPAGDLADNQLPAAAGFLNSPATQFAPPLIAMADGSAVPLPGGEKPVLTSPYRPDGGAWPPHPKGKGTQPIPLNQMPAHLQSLPVVQLAVNKGWLTAQRGGGDHSNTQFALLALWAARRHGTPSEYALLLSYQRFKRVQGPNGSWGYTLNEHGSSTMTCAGLLAVAVGLGVVPNTADKEKLDSIETQRGLDALGAAVGVPLKDENQRPPMQNLYLLWSIERVAMLHDLKTIGGKDWYGWGAQILLANQQSDGSWSGGQYLGSSPTIDTCFALLFLKRANLVGDLTESLRLRMIIRDPAAK
jgi:Prenyltransferase and squalene oxidase repeat